MSSEKTPREQTAGELIILSIDGLTEACSDKKGMAALREEIIDLADRLEAVQNQLDFYLNDHPDDEHPPRYWRNTTYAEGNSGDECVICSLESESAARMEAEAHIQNHHLEACESCAATIGEREKAEREIGRLSACLNNVSGALVDSGNPVPFDEGQYGEAVRVIIKQRDAEGR